MCPQVRSGVEPKSVHGGADIGTPWSRDRFNRLTLSFFLDTINFGSCTGPVRGGVELSGDRFLFSGDRYLVERRSILTVILSVL